MSAPDTRRTYSDSIAGYVTTYEPARDRFGLRTSDGREFTIHLDGFLSSQIVRNLGEDHRDTSAATRDMLAEGRYVFVHGLFHQWDGGERIEARQITFPEESRGAYVFEKPGWWVRQAAEIADFYLRGHFPDGVYDWRNFRTKLTLSGTHLPESAGQILREAKRAKAASSCAM